MQEIKTTRTVRRSRTNRRGGAPVVVGETNTATFPTTLGAYDRTLSTLTVPVDIGTPSRA